MSNRKGLAAIAACVALACAGVARAEVGSADQSGLTLQQPVYAQASAPRKPLMSVLDKAGLASQLDTAGIDIGGYQEMSWTHNFDDPTGDVNTGRVFDFEHDDPTWNQLGVYVNKAVKASGTEFDLGGRMEWIWGGDARVIHANGVYDFDGVSDGPDEQFDPVQFYLQANLPVGNGVIVTVGKFVTMHGFETINPTTNPLYSHSFSFGYGIPFTHLGVLAKYPINDNLSVTLGVVRGWEQAFEDNNDSHAYMVQAAYTTEQWDAYVNLMAGPEQSDNERDWRTLLNAVFVYRASDQLTLAADAVYGYEDGAGSDGGAAHWCGIAGYGMYEISDMFGLAGRVEYFNDQDGARGLSCTAYEATLGLNITPLPNNEWLSGWKIRPEVRYDWANEDIFDNDDNQLTFGVDSVLTF